eukprot:4056348-Pyramimonas_sp.AAC.1
MLNPLSRVFPACLNRIGLRAYLFPVFLDCIRTPPILHDSSETLRVPARPETMPMMGCLEEALGAILHTTMLVPLGAISGDVLARPRLP